MNLITISRYQRKDMKHIIISCYQPKDNKILTILNTNNNSNTLFKLEHIASLPKLLQNIIRTKSKINSKPFLGIRLHKNGRSSLGVNIHSREPHYREMKENLSCKATSLNRNKPPRLGNGKHDKNSGMGYNHNRLKSLNLTSESKIWILITKQLPTK